MGGGGGGPGIIGDIESLVERAKEELRKGANKRRRNVFISFAYEDVNNVNLLRGQAKNENSPIEFNDWSVSEPFQSSRAPYIKQKIGERIAQSSVTVVYISNNTEKSEWVRWEVEESLRRGKQVLGVFQGNRCLDKPRVIKQYKINCIPWSRLAETIDSLE